MLGSLAKPLLGLMVLGIAIGVKSAAVLLNYSAVKTSDWAVRPGG